MLTEKDNELVNHLRASIDKIKELYGNTYADTVRFPEIKGTESLINIIDRQSKVVEKCKEQRDRIYKNFSNATEQHKEFALIALNKELEDIMGGRG